MSLALRRIKVYSRLTLVVLAIIAICAVLWKNRSHEVKVWFFWLVDEDTPVKVIWLIVCTAVGTLVSTWILSTIWGLWRDMRKVARDSALREQEKQQEERGRKLQEQEQRIDAKLKKAISEE